MVPSTNASDGMNTAPVSHCATAGPSPTIVIRSSGPHPVTAVNTTPASHCATHRRVPDGYDSSKGSSPCSRWCVPSRDQVRIGQIHAAASGTAGVGATSPATFTASTTDHHQPDTPLTRMRSSPSTIRPLTGRRERGTGDSGLDSSRDQDERASSTVSCARPLVIVTATDAPPADTRAGSNRPNQIAGAAARPAATTTRSSRPRANAPVTSDPPHSKTANGRSTWVNPRLHSLARVACAAATVSRIEALTGPSPPRGAPPPATAATIQPKNHTMLPSPVRRPETVSKSTAAAAVIANTGAVSQRYGASSASGSTVRDSPRGRSVAPTPRSEERRVGQECGAG